MSIANLLTFQDLSRSRLQSLYSDISRQKNSNPASYNANVEWWHRTFEALVSQGLQAGSSNRLVLSANRGLVDKLRIDGVGKPLGLGAVVAELCNTKAIISLSAFLNSSQSIYDSAFLPWRIASYVIGKPFWWALEQLNVVSSEDSLNDAEWWKQVAGEYVLLDLVKKAADVIIESQRENVGLSEAESLYDTKGFRKKFSQAVDGATLSDVDVKVLLKYLERDRRVIVVDAEVIKFVNPDSKFKEITVVDRGILELKSAVQNLHAQVDDIQDKIDECTTKITLNLREKRKPMALSYLRSRKQLEDVLSKRLGSLEILQSTMLRVEAAAGDIEIMKSFESSTETLRNILAHPSLQRDKIDDTMDAMASATADARDVEDAIRIGGDMASAEIVADEELEAELGALVREAEAEKAKSHVSEEETQWTRLEANGMRVPNGPLERPSSSDDMVGHPVAVDLM